MSGRTEAPDPSGSVTHDETANLISSDRVEGAAVHDADGERIGSIQGLMIGKTDGRIAYAVLSLGGTLVTASNHYPVPWQQLTYDTTLDGYVLGMTKAQIEGAPSYDPSPDWYRRNSSWHGDVDAYWARPGSQPL